MTGQGIGRLNAMRDKIDSTIEYTRDLIDNDYSCSLYELWKTDGG